MSDGTDYEAWFRSLGIPISEPLSDGAVQCLRRLGSSEREIIRTLVSNVTFATHTDMETHRIPYHQIWEAVTARRMKMGFYTIEHPSSAAVPPVNAQFLLDLFLPEDRREEFLGDLQERYNRKLKRLGKARADWWYRKEVFASLWPLACGFAGRASRSTALQILTFLLRLVGLSAWADALKRVADAEKKRID